MKVYTVVYAGDYTHAVMSIHSTEEKAEAALAVHLAKAYNNPDDWFVNEVEVD